MMSYVNKYCQPWLAVNSYCAAKASIILLGSIAMHSIGCGLLLQMWHDLWLSVCVFCCAETAHPIKMLFLICTWVGSRYRILRWDPGSYRRRGILEAFSVIKYCEYMACSQYLQPYSVGCIRDVAFCYPYCSKLLVFVNSKKGNN